jgi:hypothetical protein
MTEVMNADGTPHSSNGRATIDDDGDFGLVLSKNILSWILKPFSRFPIGVILLPQGMYYCSVGGENTHGRQLKSMLTYVSLQGSILKELIKKLLVDNGNFNCLHKVQKSR